MARSARVQRSRVQRSRVQKFGAVVAAGGAALAISAGVAGAADWEKPTQGYVDLMVDAYQPAPGHGDSIHATCWDGDGDGAADGYELGLHPWDEVARNWQVYDAAGTMLANVTAPAHTQVFTWDEAPVRIRYAGGSYALVPADSAARLCPAPAPAPTTPTTEPTTPPTEPTTPTTETTTPTSQPTTPTNEPTTTTTVAPSTSVSVAPATVLRPAEVAVLGARATRQQLPTTGATVAELLGIASMLLFTGGLLVLGARRSVAGRRR